MSFKFYFLVLFNFCTVFWYRHTPAFDNILFITLVLVDVRSTMLSARSSESNELKKVSTLSFTAGSSDKRSAILKRLDKSIVSRTSRLIHGDGGPSVVIPCPLDPESATDMRARLHANFVGLARHGSVSTSSHATYSQGYKSWLRFCEAIQIDPRLLSVPLDSTTASVADHRLITLGTFMAHLGVDKGLKPPTVFNYVCGVQDHFRRSGYPLLPNDDPAIVELRKSLNIRFNALLPEGVGPDGRLPFTLEMLKMLIDHHTDPSIYQHLCRVICIKMGVSMVLRSCELVMTVDLHFIRGRDVVFFISVDGSTSLQQVRPRDVHLYDKSRVQLVVFNLRSRKNDQTGFGEKKPFKRREISPTCMFCLVQDAYDWACLAKPGDYEPFLSYRGIWNMSYSDFGNVIKLAARKSGFDDKRFSSHSLRIQAASVMADDNFSKTIIRCMGAWRSDSVFTYIRTIRRSQEAAVTSLADPTKLTNESVCLLYPGAQLF